MFHCFINLLEPFLDTLSNQVVSPSQLSCFTRGSQPYYVTACRFQLANHAKVGLELSLVACALVCSFISGMAVKERDKMIGKAFK